MTVAESLRQRASEPPATERGDTVWSLIEGQAREHPGRPALVDSGAEIDYARLTRRAEEIAAQLAARGVEPGALVAVCMRRTWELVATLAGILRAGCAYVPLDPAYPRPRLRAMLEHARVAAAVVDGESSARLCAGAPRLLRLSELAEGASGGEPATSPPPPRPHDLAYVLYTSGSTGRPKGVAVEHRSVAAMSRAMGTLLGEEELAGVLASASVSFDASVMEILGTLTLGGTVVLAENILELPELPAADRVRTFTTVPTALRTLLTAGPLPEGVRTVVLGGEVLARPLVDDLRSRGKRVINVYGPTEATVFATAKEAAEGTGVIPIGKPVPGCRAYVLDDSLEAVPAGEPGELYLAGEQLARGYLYDEALTKQRFFHREPTAALPDRRLYRTGDLCRWRPDGELEFLGRIDQQVKFRGFRVELEEIESALESMDGVEAAAAAVARAPAGREMLVGYVVRRNGAAEQEPADEAARAYLAERLPGYLVPQVVLPLAELPRLPNGKLDRGNLPDPGPVPSAADTPAPAAPPEAAEAGHEHLLTLVRREVASLLGFRDAAEVPADRSVLDLGLDSLTTVELAARLGALVERKVPASALLERLTPTAIAGDLLDRLGRAAQEGPRGEGSEGPGSEGPDALGGLQAKMRSCYPLFLAAKAPAWSVDDKAKFVRQLKALVSGPGRDPHSKVVRTGSGHRGIVADVHTQEEREAIIWTTNLYLGLNRDPDVIEEAGSALRRLGTGMGTSAVAGGVTDLHLEFERELAELVGKPAACLFPTGYTANLGVVAGMLGEGDVVVMDQLCHASIVDGARLSGAKIRTFQHNNPADLDAVLRTEASPYRTVLVVLEGVYSMGEGAAAVAEIARVAKAHGALVLVDEAHSFGFYGPRGGGICAEQGVTDQVDFIMTTLSKAMGSLGGVIAASEDHIALLKSSARSYIFQASTSPADIAAALAALRRLRDDDSLRERLWDTTAYMRRRFTEAGYDLGPGDTPVVTPHFPDKDKLFAIVDGLYQRGILASAVTYPVVEAGKGRLRLICSAAHTREDVDRTLEALIDAEREADEKLRERQGGRGEGDGGGSEGPDRSRLPEQARLQGWAQGFAARVAESLAEAPGTAPDLALSFGIPGEEPVRLLVREGKVTAGSLPPPGALTSPSCSLLLTDARALDALREGDLQHLLASVLDGTCVLSGRVEPFVWWVGRMADQGQAGSL